MEDGSTEMCHVSKDDDGAKDANGRLWNDDGDGDAREKGLA